MRQLELDILPQPDDTTCGPTCLHAVYRYFEDELPLSQVIAETPKLDDGGTLGVLLATHALRRGYAVTAYTYNLRVFDPTWFEGASSLRESAEGHWEVEEHPSPRSDCAPVVDVVAKLRAQIAVKTNPKLRRACRAYAEFVEAGGRLLLRDLGTDLLIERLEAERPILTGLSATYLYRCERELPEDCSPDDIRGFPAGHFVVLCGYDSARRTVTVADPWLTHPFGGTHHYEVPIERLVCAILLGVLTYDANLIIIEPDS